ncbi:MAG: UDP-N-acetylmuramoyl-L-alanine--D-glutamate ligase [Acetoanaerobium sp.]|nr:UDP-N-acetylmuramoyl-L-alanine--D-glutamate ligase [Acetoanaerobium sp.]
MKNNIIIVGLGKTGFCVLDYFINQDVNIQVFDSKTDYDSDKIAKLSSNKNVIFNLGKNPTGDEEADMVVMSPGISLDLEFVKKFISRNIEVTGEIELSYRYGKGRFVGITGTNGKTTTTTLVGDIFKAYKSDTKVVGNIGYPALEQAVVSEADTFLITELSSFQLESIKTFRPYISAILNITEDHLNRHKTMSEYIKAKFRIFENQSSDEFLVLNYDDELLRLSQSEIKPKIVYFSRKEILKEGIFVENEQIVACIANTKEYIMDVKDILLLGQHNLENVLAAVSISVLAGIDKSIIKQEVMNFRGVEHRLELVRTYNDVNYINDSKATNPDSSIKALEAMNTPVVLIAGGMDKQSDYSSFIDSCIPKVKHLILLGETKDVIEKTAISKGLVNITKVEDMKQAVNVAFLNAKEGDTVLLSPACASWDMYESFEHRGKDFKNCVLSL